MTLDTQEKEWFKPKKSSSNRRERSAAKPQP